MIHLPMKCRLCGKIISPPDEARIIGQPETVQNQKIIARLMAHIGKHAQEEQRSGGPHAQALIEATLASQNLHASLIIGCFQINPEMEADRQRVFARIHELTRTVRITDEDLKTIAQENGFVLNFDHWAENENLLDMLRDLRDRYESLGKYAPAQPEPIEAIKR